MKTTFGSIKMLQRVFDYSIVSWIISWLLCFKLGGFPGSQDAGLPRGYIQPHGTRHHRHK